MRPSKSNLVNYATVSHAEVFSIYQTLWVTLWITLLIYDALIIVYYIIQGCGVGVVEEQQFLVESKSIFFILGGVGVDNFQTPGVGIYFLQATPQPMVSGQYRTTAWTRSYKFCTNKFFGFW